MMTPKEHRILCERSGVPSPNCRVFPFLITELEYGHESGQNNPQFDGQAHRILMDRKNQLEDFIEESWREGVDNTEKATRMLNACALYLKYCGYLKKIGFGGVSDSDISRVVAERASVRKYLEHPDDYSIIIALSDPGLGKEQIEDLLGDKGGSFVRLSDGSDMSIANWDVAFEGRGYSYP